MQIKTKKSPKILTKNSDGTINGYLVPLYNINDNFFEKGKEPHQVYMTVIDAGKIKGPHLHYIRTGCFTCIKGNARFILKTEKGYEIFYSGEDYEYQSVIVPTGTPAALQNIGQEEAFVLNMPNPAWTPTMSDEYSADFSDFDFNNLK
jgi:oxalate decarboxylase/phosphoglucose isomerase-like protein (cupin superfamily)